MVCPYCQHTDTRVTNSRHHKDQPKIWRRRHCERCKTTFTTYEQIAEKELPLVITDQGQAPFSRPRLLISIYGALPESLSRADDAAALVETTYQKLCASSPAVLDPQTIAHHTYETLRRFSPAAGLIYGVSHNIVTADSLRR